MEQLWFNKYSPIDLLSSNNNAESYKALNVRIGEKRFIKRIYKQAPYYSELKKEAEILKKLDNKHIPHIYDIEEDDNYYYIIEQYIEGKTLKNFCDGQKEISVSELLGIALQICNIVEYLHAMVPMILHLDITCDNLLIAEDKVFLVDFGSAATISDRANKEGRCFFGTKHFCAPEQEIGVVDERTDLYAIGCVIDYMLKLATGDKKRLRLLAGLVDRCCEAEIEKRLDGVGLLRCELQRLYRREEETKKSEFNCERRGRTVTVGVLGAFKGAGATRISLMLAAYFRKKGNRRVAIVENSGRKDLQCMEEYASGFLSKEALKGFRLKGISFFSTASDKTLLKLRDEAFDYLIIDMGSLTDSIPEELMRCDYRIIVTNRLPWKAVFNTRLEDILEAVSGYGWYVFINLQSELRSKLLLKRGIKQIPIGFCEELFSISTKTRKALKTLF